MSDFLWQQKMRHWWFNLAIEDDEASRFTNAILQAIYGEVQSA